MRAISENRLSSNIYIVPGFGSRKRISPVLGGLVQRRTGIGFDLQLSDPWRKPYGESLCKVFSNFFRACCIIGAPIRTWMKKMEMIGASEARRHLSQLLDRVARGESLTITRHGKPVARLVPIATREERAREALGHVAELRQHIKLAPLAELMVTTHEGHRY